MTGIPQAIGAAAVAAIKFITPSPQGASSKIDTPAKRPSSSYSEIKPMVDLNQVVFGVLGVAALGTVGYGVYASSQKKKKRRIDYGGYYKRSADEDELWMRVLSGRTLLFKTRLKTFQSISTFIS